MMIILGTVKYFDAARGIGFATPDDGSPDCFLHRSEIRANDEDARTLADGQRIAFEVRSDERGRRAVHIMPRGIAYSAATRGR